VLRQQDIWNMIISLVTVAMIWRKKPKNQPLAENGEADNDSEYRWDDSKWKVPTYQHWYAGNSDYQSDERRYWWHQVWALWVNVGIGLLTLIAAVIVGRIAYHAYQASVDAVGEARKQPTEAHRQADAAEDQIAVAKDVEERQLRAYIVFRVQEKLDNFAVGGIAHVQGILDNVGQTPVYNSNVLSGIAVLDFPLKGPLAFAPCNLIMSRPDARRHFFGKESYPGKVGDTPFTEDEITRVKNRTSAVYHYGRVCYLDIFQKTRHTEFCVFWAWDNGAIQSPEYCQYGNTADEPDGPWPPTGPPQPPTSTK
jgi:hypothetical protein